MRRTNTHRSKKSMSVTEATYAVAVPPCCHSAPPAEPPARHGFVNGGNLTFVRSGILFKPMRYHPPSLLSKTNGTHDAIDDRAHRGDTNVLAAES